MSRRVLWPLCLPDVYKGRKTHSRLTRTDPLCFHATHLGPPRCRRPMARSWPLTSRPLTTSLTAHCAVGLVRVEAMTVVHRETLLIQPPRPRFVFTHIHGITWEMVKGACKVRGRLATPLPAPGRGIGSSGPQRAIRPAGPGRLLRGRRTARPGVAVPVHRPTRPPALASEAERPAFRLPTPGDRARAPRPRVRRRGVRPDRHRGAQRSRRGDQLDA